MLGPTVAERLGIQHRARVVGIPVGPSRYDWVRLASLGMSAGAAAVGLRRALRTIRSGDIDGPSQVVGRATAVSHEARERVGAAAAGAVEDVGTRLRDMFPPPEGDVARHEDAASGDRAAGAGPSDATTADDEPSVRGEGPGEDDIDEQEGILRALEALEDDVGFQLGEVLWVGRPLSPEHGDAHGWIGTVTLLETSEGGVETAQPAAYLIAAGVDGELYGSRRLGRY